MGGRGVKITADTNVLVRTVVEDDAEQAAAARALLQRASVIAVPVPVFCELAWVLKRAYGRVATDIAAAIEAIAQTGTVATDVPAVEAGLAALQGGRRLRRRGHRPPGRGARRSRVRELRSSGSRTVAERRRCSRRTVGSDCLKANPTLQRCYFRERPAAGLATCSGHLPQGVASRIFVVVPRSVSAPGSPPSLALGASIGDHLIAAERRDPHGRQTPSRLPICPSSKRVHSGGSGLTCSIACRFRTAICRYVVPLLSYRSIRVKA